MRVYACVYMMMHDYSCAGPTAHADMPAQPIIGIITHADDQEDGLKCRAGTLWRIPRSRAAQFEVQPCTAAKCSPSTPVRPLQHKYQPCLLQLDSLICRQPGQCASEARGAAERSHGLRQRCRGPCSWKRGNLFRYLQE